MKIVRYYTESGQVRLAVVKEIGGKLRAVKVPQQHARRTPLEIHQNRSIRAEIAGSVVDASKQPGDFEFLGPDDKIAPSVLPSEVNEIMCIGLNCEKHAAEGGLPKPEHTVWFPRTRTDIVGPYQHVVVPPPNPNFPDVEVKFDYEIELALLVGKSGLNIPVEKALEYVAGYFAGGDYSDRGRQFREGPNSQWGPGKTLAYACPLGPVMDLGGIEDANKANLALRLKVNDSLRQNGTTGTPIFPIAQALSDKRFNGGISAGDVILTGTPIGVVFKGPNEPEHPYLNKQIESEEVVVSASVTGLGTMANKIVAMDESWTEHFAAGRPFKAEHHGAWNEDYLQEIAV